MHLYSRWGQHDWCYILHRLNRRRKFPTALQDRQLLGGLDILRPGRRERRVTTAHSQAPSLSAVRSCEYFCGWCCVFRESVNLLGKVQFSAFYAKRKTSSLNCRRLVSEPMLYQLLHCCHLYMTCLDLFVKVVYVGCSSPEAILCIYNLKLCIK